jgi:threonine/homoserine/homoserine lactone efflux protein
MKPLTKYYGDFFYRTLATVAIGAPMLLTLADSQLPEGTERGEFMVSGLGTVLAVLVTALVLRAAYILGFNKAFSIVSSELNRSVTA